LNKNGIQTEKVTLHVSLGTFQPINTEKIEDFHIHSEYFEISKETAERLNKAKKEGRRIIAVGTTPVRVLETAARYCRHCEERSDEAIPASPSGRSKENRSPRPYRSRDDNNFIEAMSGETDIYIYPGYKFKFIDGLITNFHLPKSSLLLLVSAFAGKENILRAYRHAIDEKYRFYSYGDGMLILFI
jgi:S-adenosylmethionine:tRNA ribosyltransferase-isomerase